jgi:hypothetical protein
MGMQNRLIAVVGNSKVRKPLARDFHAGEPEELGHLKSEFNHYWANIYFRMTNHSNKTVMFVQEVEEMLAVVEVGELVQEWPLAGGYFQAQFVNSPGDVGATVHQVAEDGVPGNGDKTIINKLCIRERP